MENLFRVIGSKSQAACSVGIGMGIDKWLRLLGVIMLLGGLFGELAGSAQHALAVPPPDPVATAPARDNERVGIGTTTGNLLYQGGRVLSGTTAYVIYWQPSGYTVASGYTQFVDKFLENVARDSGKATNVFSGMAEYTDSAGNIGSYNVTFGGSVVDSSPYPASGCKVTGMRACLTDNQIRDKVRSVITAQGWGGGTGAINKLFFLLTPKDVASCYDRVGGYCSFEEYCAYHHYFPVEGSSSSDNYYYAHIAYSMSRPAKCGSFSQPNGTDGDSTVNILAHEYGEMVTDPMGQSWRDRTRLERADKCAWVFGQPLGWTGYGKYNQIIGTGRYYLQSQWSNNAEKCVLAGIS